MNLPLKKPISPTYVVRILTVLVVFLALTTGYYQTLYSSEVKKYKKLEDMYVRVRQILGVDETQRLIDLSHELEQSDRQDNW